MIKCKVEFFGGPRQLLGIAETELELGDNPSLRQVLARLVERWPQLRGRVSSPDGSSLVAPYAFNLNGQLFASSLETPVKESDSILLMMASIGG